MIHVGMLFEMHSHRTRIVYATNEHTYTRHISVRLGNINSNFTSTDISSIPIVTCKQNQI